MPSPLGGARLLPPLSPPPPPRSCSSLCAPSPSMSTAWDTSADSRCLTSSGTATRATAPPSRARPRTARATARWRGRTWTFNQVAATHWPSLIPPQARWRSHTSTSSCTTRRGGAAMARRGTRDVFSRQPFIIHHQARRGRSAHRPYRGPRQCRCGAAAGGSSGKQLARPARSGAAHRTTHGAEPTLDSRLWRYGTRRDDPSLRAAIVFVKAGRPLERIAEASVLPSPGSRGGTRQSPRRARDRRRSAACCSRSRQRSSPTTRRSASAHAPSRPSATARSA